MVKVIGSPGQDNSSAASYEGVTVMFAVMEIIQKIINAVIVMPVKMCQTISEHIVFRCHYRFLLQI